MEGSDPSSVNNKAPLWKLVESEIVAEPRALSFVAGMNTWSTNTAGTPPGKPNTARP